MKRVYLIIFQTDSLIKQKNNVVIFFYILGLNNSSPNNGVNNMYHMIGKTIKIKDGMGLIIGINIIGTSEYLRND